MLGSKIPSNTAFCFLANGFDPFGNIMYFKSELGNFMQNPVENTFEFWGDCMYILTFLAHASQRVDALHIVH